MQTANYLKILKDEIHSVVFATTDKNGLPDARVIDQLMKQKFAAISGMTDGKHSFEICPEKAILKRGG